MGAVLLLGTCFALVAGDPRPARGFDRDAVFGAAGLLESAELALESGDLLTAERDARSAVEIYATNLQDTHMWTAAARLTLGMVLVEAGDYPGALEQLDRAVPTFRMFFGGDDSMPAVHLANLGALYAQAGEYGQGLSFVREAVAALEATGDETALAEVRLNEAQILRVIGDYAGAERLLTETLDSARIRVLLPHRLPDLAFLIAELRLNLANTAGARASLEEALADSDLLDPADRRQLRAEALRLEGDITRKEGDPVRAVELGERAVEQLADLLGPTDSTTRQARNSLALSLQDAGRHGEALAILQDLVAGLEEAFPGGHPDLAVAWTSTAWNAWLVGDRALAMELYGRAPCSAADSSGWTSGTRSSVDRISRRPTSCSAPPIRASTPTSPTPRPASRRRPGNGTTPSSLGSRWRRRSGSWALPWETLTRTSPPCTTTSRSRSAATGIIEQPGSYTRKPSGSASPRSLPTTPTC